MFLKISGYMVKVINYWNIFTDCFNLKSIDISQCAYLKSFMFQFSQKIKIDFEISTQHWIV